MSEVKRCFKCGLRKPLEDFYKHPAMADGRLGKCKVCAKADASQARLAKIEHYRAYDRRRGNRQVGYGAKYNAMYPQRRKAHIAVGNALRAGRIVATPCLVCGAKAEAHHPDYSMPLDVVWLCPAHHKQAHAMARKAA